MPDDYSTTDAMEHVERTHELLERSENALLRFVPLLAAVLAVFAGLSSLYAGRLGEEILTQKNEAVLHEVTSSDLWGEYQAESLKSHLYAIAALTQSGRAREVMQATAKKYRTEQVPLRAQARSNEVARDQALEESTALARRKVRFDIALAFFEVSIVLASIAAMIKKPFLFALAGLGGLAGLFFSLRGIIQ